MRPFQNVIGVTKPTFQTVPTSNIPELILRPPFRQAGLY